MIETVVFENDGLIDIRAIKILGVSVKESENPIGFFGTGLKYAIAILLRNKHSVTICIGKDVYEFDTILTNIRGKEFEVIRMNKEELGFTTDYGKSWELWQAYRELYCNAIDEQGGEVYLTSNKVAPKDNKTLVVVKGTTFAEVHSNRHLFILPSSNSVSHNTVCEVHEGTSQHIFYRSIRAGGNPDSLPSLFTYNITEKCELTEDRTIAWDYAKKSSIVRGICLLEDKHIIRQILTADSGVLEGEIDLNYVTAVMSDVFKETLIELGENEPAKLTLSALKLFYKITGRKARPSSSTLNEIEKKQLEKATDFLISLGYTKIINYEIIVSDELGSKRLGQVYFGEPVIYLSRRSFNEGTRCVAGTLLEEFLHLDSTYCDYTPEFQNLLIDQIVMVGERFILKQPL